METKGLVLSAALLGVAIYAGAVRVSETGRYAVVGSDPHERLDTRTGVFQWCTPRQEGGAVHWTCDKGYVEEAASPASAK
jgi:hypothetical protein